MFFKGDKLAVRIVSVHKLSWNGRRINIAPKSTYALSYRKKGCASFTRGDGTVHAHDGDVMYFPKDVGYNLDAGEEELYAVNFDCADEETARMLCSDIINVGTYGRDRVAELFYEAHRLWTLKKCGFYPETVSIFYKIIALITQQKQKVVSGNAGRLEPVMDYLNANLTDPNLSVAKLAEVIGVSETYLRRIFFASTGKNPRQYVTERRIEYAQELLKGGFLGVEQTCRACGYEDPKYFATVFKRKVGMTPSEYKSKYDHDQL